MSQTFSPSLFNIPPVPRRRPLPQRTPISGHHKQASVPHEANTRQNAVDFEISISIQPRRDAIVHRERQRVSYDNASRDHRAGQLGVARDGVRQRGSDAERGVDGNGHLAEDQGHPVQVVGDAKGVEDHGEGAEEHACDEEVELPGWLVRFMFEVGIAV